MSSTTVKGGSSQNITGLCKLRCRWENLTRQTFCEESQAYSNTQPRPFVELSPRPVCLIQMHVSHPSTVAQHLNPKEGITPYNIESTCILPMRFLIARPRILGEVRHTLNPTMQKSQLTSIVRPMLYHRGSAFLIFFMYFETNSHYFNPLCVTLVSPPGTQNAGDATVAG